MSNADTDFLTGLPQKTKLPLVCVGAWMAGLLAYVAALGAIWRQTISAGDLVAVAFWSALAYGICLVAVYLPVLRGLRRLLPGGRPRWPFPLAAILLGVVPTAIVGIAHGGQLRHALTPEAMLFYVLFAAVGLVLGLGVAWVEAERPAA